MWVLVLAPLGLVMVISFGINRLSPVTALTLFFVYAGLLGLSLATIFMVYTGASIARVFFISAATFGAMSLYGYTTKRDLTGFGSFLFMGLIGIVIASLVNIFLHSSGLNRSSRWSACLSLPGSPPTTRKTSRRCTALWTTAPSPAAKR